MKVILLSVMMFSLLFSAKIDDFASEVNYLRDYKTALTTAKEQKKMMMVVVVGDYCPWCKKFERKTLKSSEVKAQVNENFVPVVIDKYKDKGKYPEAFYAPLIPAVYFVDPSNEKALLTTVAYMKKQEYIENMDDALSLFNEEAEK